MKLSKIAMLAAALCTMHMGAAAADDYTNAYASAVVPASCTDGCDTDGCDIACGCSDSSCDGMCGGCSTGLGIGDLFGDCCLGDPYSVFGDYNGWSVGGWGQLGYHSQNGQNRFNNYADKIQMQQLWMYAEKVADGSCGLDIGGRIDFMYGTDANDTQAFGPNNDSWDQTWDNGPYGWALPQLYVEAAYGDLSVKAGHFYTAIGYEVVAAPDNFFYSHAYTMYNNEPFTHTGFLATYDVSSDLSVFGGYTFGWDSGYVDNGDNFLGGFTVGMSEDVSLTYATTIGRFGTNGALGAATSGVQEEGYMHSMVFDVALTEKTTWISQWDYINTHANNTDVNFRKGFALVNYLMYDINDCTAVGTRFEYFHRDPDTGVVGDDNVDVYDLTFGLNHRFNSNLIVRPELRWDWDKDGDFAINENNAASQTTFGMDAILTF
ncbi:hypothetical protein FF011L_50470 [Roseimaritima multifibrata]|uniref:Porin n=2 Tax=Roseimaritima multifibrata TaxID=1930274 RepID=A0A517MMY0_9BACT|nr:hypothetical protein FF011L_50470 [Roseimaritima multifibrata]